MKFNKRYVYEKYRDDVILFFRFFLGVVGVISGVVLILGTVLVGVYCLAWLAQILF